jgi:hypothetical protein
MALWYQSTVVLFLNFSVSSIAIRFWPTHFVSGKALDAGTLPLVAAIHPILRLQDVNHDLFQILVRIRELNVATLRPALFVTNRIPTLPQNACGIRPELIANSFYVIGNAIVLVACLWDYLTATWT